MEFLQEEFINDSFGNCGLEKIHFPFFDVRLDNKRYFFNQINIKKGGIIHVKSESKENIFYDTICGLIIPKQLPEDREFLKYKISYKKRDFMPKFEGTVLDLLESKENDKKKDYFNLYYILDINSFLNKKVKELTENEKEQLSLFMLLNEESDIFIYDYQNLVTVDNKIKTDILNFIYKNFRKNNKYFITNSSFLENINFEKNIYCYEINNINNDNQYIGKINL